MKSSKSILMAWTCWSVVTAPPADGRRYTGPLPRTLSAPHRSPCRHRLPCARGPGGRPQNSAPQRWWQIYQGIDHHPVQAVHLAVGGPCSHIVGSQGIDAGLDDDIGYIYMTDCIPAGIPIRTILWSILWSMRTFFHSSLYISSVFIRARTTRTALKAGR